MHGRHGTATATTTRLVGRRRVEGLLTPTSSSSSSGHHKGHGGTRFVQDQEDAAPQDERHKPHHDCCDFFSIVNQSTQAIEQICGEMLSQSTHKKKKIVAILSVIVRQAS